jgi:hypothetical protein
MAACAPRKASSSATDQSPYPWSLSLVSWKIGDRLTGTRTETQYDGRVSERQVEKRPAAGMVYLVLDLSLRKQAPGEAVFSWKDLRIEDRAGEQIGRAHV